MVRLLASALLVALWSMQLPPGGPVVSVWYRGNAAGAPILDELAAIRALGFTGVTWPEAQVAGLPALHRFAKTVDLTVVVRARSTPLGATAATSPGAQVDIRVGASGSSTLVALAWRAIAHGVRVISFDAGQPTGSGVSDMNGVRPNWVRPAVGIARQVTANPTLLEDARPASSRLRPVVPLPRGLDVVLLETRRAWLIVATNTATTPARGVLKMPAGVPAALWVSLTDGETMSMLSQPGGAQWTVDVEAGGAQVYVIDKGTESDPVPLAYSSNAAPRIVAFSGPCPSKPGSGVVTAVTCSRVLPAFFSAATNASSAPR
jgi:hypothetical protein